MIAKVTYISLLISMLGLISCATTRPTGVPQSVILEKINHNQNKITSIRGEAKLDFHLDGQKGTLSAVILAQKSGQKPERLRLEVSNFFGVPLTAMTLKDNELTYYLIAEKKMYVSSPPDDLAVRVLPLGIDHDDLKELLFFTRKGYQRFKSRGDFDIAYFDFIQDKKSLLFYPQGMRLTHLSSDDYVQMRWGSIEINSGPFSSEVFQLSRPASVRIIRWKKEPLPHLLAH